MRAFTLPWSRERESCTNLRKAQRLLRKCLVASSAGWVRMGNQHAMSMKPEEDIEAFRLRVSLKIPLGPHLEMLTPGQMKQWEAAQPPPPAEPKPRKA